MIYLTRKFGKEKRGTECLLADADNIAILYHWTVVAVVDKDDAVKIGGCLEGKLWNEIGDEIAANSTWKNSMDVLPLAALIIALRKEMNDE